MVKTNINLLGKDGFEFLVLALQLLKEFLEGGGHLVQFSDPLPHLVDEAQTFVGLSGLDLLEGFQELLDVLFDLLRGDLRGGVYLRSFLLFLLVYLLGHWVVPIVLFFSVQINQLPHFGAGFIVDFSDGFSEFGFLGFASDLNGTHLDGQEQFFFSRALIDLRFGILSYARSIAFDGQLIHQFQQGHQLGKCLNVFGFLGLFKLFAGVLQFLVQMRPQGQSIP